MNFRNLLVGCLAGLLLYVQMGQALDGSNLVYAAKAKNKPEEKQVKYMFSVLPGDIPKDEKYILGFYYGNGENILIRENAGRLEALFKTQASDRSFARANVYPLTKLHFDAYTLQEAGPLYNSEVEVKFVRDSDGYGISCRIGGHSYSRAFFGQTEGERAAAFRIPEHSQEEWADLRNQAKQAVMPDFLQTDHVAKLVRIDNLPGIHAENVYATADNLFAAPLYTTTDLYLAEPAALALQDVMKDLAKFGYGIIVYDAYRPWYISKLAHLALPERQKNMLEDPDTQGSAHNTGTAIDVGLYDLSTGESVSLGSGFDEPSPRQYSSYVGGTSRERKARELLRTHMILHGFAGIEMEWWHFEYKPEEKWSVQNVDI